MPLHAPPGRSGRPWLAHRLRTAARAAELLDQKLRALQAEEHRLAGEAAAAEEEWVRAIRLAERWSARASVLGGRRAFDLVAAHATQPAGAEVRWRSWMGVSYPAEADVRPGRAGSTMLGGTAALEAAASAYATAVTAGVRSAVAARALELVRAELLATATRQRALEHRWVPMLGDALLRLEATLDEQEREDGIRARWLRSRAAQGVGDGAGTLPGGRPSG